VWYFLLWGRFTSSDFFFGAIIPLVFPELPYYVLFISVTVYFCAILCLIVLSKALIIIKLIINLALKLVI